MDLDISGDSPMRLLSVDGIWLSVADLVSTIVGAAELMVC